ncbi:MAG: GGDEF domain-containing protein [Endomicrobiales bacterium]|nr:GGDEF domain-containing protein [Endomicrobiales bacterium]
MNKFRKYVTALSGAAAIAVLACAAKIAGFSTVALILCAVPVFAMGYYLGLYAGSASFFGCTAVIFYLKFTGGPAPNVPEAAVLILLYGACVYLSLELGRLKKIRPDTAGKDELTNLLNGRSFFDLLNVEIKRAIRDNLPLTNAYIDIDGLKGINSKYGRKTGDRLLRIVADCIRRHVRGTDMAARLKDDEFLVLMPGLDKEDVRSVIGKLHSSLLDEAEKNGIKATFSIAVATCSRPRETADVMVQLTDSLMRQAKRNGDNSVKYEACEFDEI